jgi:hypothetical protein
MESTHIIVPLFLKQAQRTFVALLPKHRFAFKVQRTFVALLPKHKFAFKVQRTFVALLPTMHKIAQFNKRMGKI